MRRTTEGREETDVDEGKSGKSIKFDPNSPSVYHYQLNAKPSHVSIKLVEGVGVIPKPVESPCCQIY